MTRTRYERAARDLIVQAALDCVDASDRNDDAAWDEANERLWDAVTEFRKGRVSDQIWIGKRGKIGRPWHPRASEIIAAAKAGGESVRQIARRIGCHRNTVYYVLANHPDARATEKESPR